MRIKKLSLEEQLCNPQSTFEDVCTSIDSYCHRALHNSHVERPKIVPDRKRDLLDVKFGDSGMTYVQFLIVQGNADLLKNVLLKPDGR